MEVIEEPSVEIDKKTGKKILRPDKPKIAKIINDHLTKVKTS